MLVYLLKVLAFLLDLFGLCQGDNEAARLLLGLKVCRHPLAFLDSLDDVHVFVDHLILLGHPLPEKLALLLILDVDLELKPLGLGEHIH